MSQTQRIAVYSISDLKNTTDDALSPYLRDRKQFVQNHMLSDVRLTLGYTAVVIAAITFYFDYTSSWEKTKGWTLWAVVGYFAINSALTLWIWGIEKGKIFAGNKDDLLISIASHVDKHEPTYHLKIRYSDPSDKVGLSGKLLEVEAPFTKWFTSDGKFVTENFYGWLETALSFLNQANKNALKSK